MHPADVDVISLLVQRDGKATLVTLKNGLGLTVHNIAWGYEIGDEYAHVTTNIDPEVDGACSTSSRTRLSRSPIRCQARRWRERGSFAHRQMSVP